VDDSGLIRRLLSAALAELGHEVETAEHGRRALEMLGEGDFDVVLLDLLMPVLDGYSTLAEIKADPALEHLPVIMVSAVQDMDSVVRCIELGATDYLPKPFSAAMLRARLRSSLAAKRLRDAERSALRRLEDVLAAEGDDRLRRLTAMSREVAEREAALRAEIAELRGRVAR
jgi:CheY-like chemotaxis protein